MALSHPVRPGGEAAVALPLALTQLGEALRARPLGPDPAFRAALRARVVAVATVAPHQQAPVRVATRARGMHLRLRFARIAIAAVAASVAVTGLSLATTRSLPGDPLYGAKRAAESFQLAFAGSTLDRGLLHLELARTRLGEVKDLIARDDAALPAQIAAPSPLSGTGVPQGLSAHTARLVASTLVAMDHETRVGAALVTTAYLQQRKAAPIAKLQTFVADQAAGLTAVLPTIPTSARPQADASLQLLNSVNLQANQLLENAPPVVPLPPPRPVVLPTARNRGGSAVVVPSDGGPVVSGRPSEAPSSSGSTAPGSVAPPSPAPSDEPSDSGTPSDHSSPTPGSSSSPSDGPSPSAGSAQPSPSAAPSPSATPSAQQGIIPWPF